MEDRESVESRTKKSSISSGGRVQEREEFLRRFVDSESLVENLKTWYGELAKNSEEPPFDAPFELVDLQKFDYALEGVPFQQLVRIPSAIYDSASGAVEATAYLALEDFLHASVKGLIGTNPIICKRKKQKKTKRSRRRQREKARMKRKKTREERKRKSWWAANVKE
ncbi:uncharacterized protein LOC107781483 [Nicotiana tabacum]|uniref:Uncharacterized protein LOC107781483 n=2 Tax=Nicotiana TaxID=4085 RepID=A0AC58UKQ3_TOBAC|nr:PREDICTED: uncharacterized protein LOC104219106 [Nicotiana sylvestris]